MDMQSLMILMAMVKEWLLRVHLWWKMPVVLILVYQLQKRELLMRDNLFEAYPSSDRKPTCQDPVVGLLDMTARTMRSVFCTERMREGRTHDGTCNDLKHPAMGCRLYRFSRNVNPNSTHEDDKMLELNPREISQRLLKRTKFIPVKQLNLLAASWIQFMIHDWFDHGDQDRKNRISVPLEGHDPLYSKHAPAMSIPRTRPDNCQQEPGSPPAYQNDVTHWWDGSQLYGSDEITNKRLRSFVGGKLEHDAKGLLKLDRNTGLDMTGFNRNWWVGLSLLHNIFTREHNAICGMLHKHYPDWSDEKLYDKARLINVAQMVKIHTIEWTPAILNDTALREGVRVNWGLRPGREIFAWLHSHNISSDVGITPLVGNAKKMRGVNFSLTEEFVAVYRMHPLLPDQLRVRNIRSREYTGHEYSLPKYSFAHAREIVEEHGFADLLYTFGVEYPGALTLFNYPQALMNLKLPWHQMGGETVDLGTIDILRDRERGVPRFNDFRRKLKLRPVESFEKLTSNKHHSAALKDMYCGDMEKLDLLIGCLAEEPRPYGYGFGETAFNLFLMMASRRLETDRFLTDDFTDDMYTPEGMQWIKDSTMKTILLRNYPEAELLPTILMNVENAFFPWE
ncbi:predicted protein [Nematostella vectensis]|uniref:Uncharacterized protein n=1 Tax=Nematostella vectensis TaxID=45351 RepID=A7RRR3_NEMVE|nr:predicted protein [Nematostella vectensis]|eukprot:XP_001637870.1 predicted protein [Nematostella vectensis]